MFTHAKKALVILAVLTTIAATGWTWMAGASSDEDEFARQVIDIGVVVSDLDRSLEFYQEVVGMTRTGAFDLDEDFGRRSGLTNGLPVHIEVLKLGSEPQATAFKLMTFGDRAASQPNAHIHDHTGVQYITLNVIALRPFLDRIEAHDVDLLGDTPTQLPNGHHFALIQDPEGTFIELIGPMEAEE